MLRFEKNGFTLIEMLVVLAIIAILLGTSAAAITGAKRSAYRTKSTEIARQFCQAWGAYLNDEREFPKASYFKDGVGDDFFEASAYNIGALLNTQYNHQGSGKGQRRAVANKIYFDTTKSECERSGTGPNYTYKGTGLIDSWKEPIIFSLDFDSDGRIEGVPNREDPITATACAYSKANSSNPSKFAVVY